jgi:hypothetical protein
VEVGVPDEGEKCKPTIGVSQQVKGAHLQHISSPKATLHKDGMKYTDVSQMCVRTDCFARCVNGFGIGSGWTSIGSGLSYDLDENG